MARASWFFQIFRQPRRLMPCQLSKLAAAWLLWSGVATAATAGHLVADDLHENMQAVTDAVTGILGYARWPDPPEHLRLCVTGPTEYADVLLQSGTLAPLWESTVPRVQSRDALLTSGCQALYIGVLSEQEKQQLFDRIQDLPILTISEQNQTCATGSMFCLNIGDGVTTFQVNLDSVARSGIRIHPNVLRLSKLRLEGQ